MEISHLTRKAVHGIIPWLNLGAMDPCRELSVSKKYPSTVCVQPGIGCVFYSPSKGILNWLIYIYIIISIYCVNNVSNVIQESSNVTTLPIEHTSFQWPVLFSFLKLHWPYMDTIGFSWNILHIIGLSTGHSVLEIINWHGHRGRIDLAFFRWSTACSARLGIKDVWQMKRSYIWDIMEGILAESLEVTQAVLNLTVFLVTFATVEP